MTCITVGQPYRAFSSPSNTVFMCAILPRGTGTWVHRLFHGCQGIQNCFLADIDECQTESHNCSAPAQCVNFEGGFSCSCNTGYMLNDTTYANCEGMPIKLFFS